MGEVGVIAQARVHLRKLLVQSLGQVLDAATRAEDVIGGNAGLAGIHALAEGNALGRVIQRYIGGDDGR